MPLDFLPVSARLSASGGSVFPGRTAHASISSVGGGGVETDQVFVIVAGNNPPALRCVVQVEVNLVTA